MDFTKSKGTPLDMRIALSQGITEKYIPDDITLEGLLAENLYERIANEYSINTTCHKKSFSWKFIFNTGLLSIGISDGAWWLDSECQEAAGVENVSNDRIIWNNWLNQT